MSVQGHPRSKIMMPIERSLMVSYLTSIVSDVVSRTVFEIFDAKIPWPWIRTIQGHSRSKVMVPIDSPCTFAFLVAKLGLLSRRLSGWSEATASFSRGTLVITAVLHANYVDDVDRSCVKLIVTMWPKDMRVTGCYRAVAQPSCLSGHPKNSAYECPTPHNFGLPWLLSCTTGVFESFYFFRNS